MGGGGGKGGFFADTGGWFVNPLEKAFGDVGGWISNPLYKVVEKAGYGWVEPIGAATSGYVQATRKGEGQFQDLTNPLLFGESGTSRVKRLEENRQAWKEYYQGLAAQTHDRIRKLYGPEAVVDTTGRSSQTPAPVPTTIEVPRLKGVPASILNDEDNNDSLLSTGG